MLEAIKQSRALKWLLIWGGILVGILLVIHFFSKKQPGASGANGATSAGMPAGANGTSGASVENVTVLVNGYQPGPYNNNIPVASAPVRVVPIVVHPRPVVPQLQPPYSVPSFPDRHRRG